MFIESIELKNFRNIESLRIKLDPGTNLFYGDNAQGKTNILEAIYMACTSKSHRMSRDRDIIRFQENEAHIKALIMKKGVPCRIDIHLKKNRTKGIAVDETPVKKASELFGIANVVCFSPEDLGLVKDGPASRRRFMDMELCQLDKVYLYSLTRYNRTMEQRNKLLRDAVYNCKLLDTLSAWDDELVKYGRKVMQIREGFIIRMKDIISSMHDELTGGKEKLSISYEPDVSIDDFEKNLHRLREAELKQHLTLTGPHRDDIRFSIDGLDVRKYGSQGQKRTAALALKLSEIEIIRELVKDNPILLLDDVLSELDSKRQKYLLKNISDTQNIITCTGYDDYAQNQFHVEKLYRVMSGKVSFA